MGTRSLPWACRMPLVATIRHTKMLATPSTVR